MKAARPYRAPAPESADTALALDRLGGLVSTHAPAPLPRALVGPILLSAIFASFIYFTHPSLPLVTSSGLVMLAILAWPPLQTRGFSVELHEHGLVLARSSGKRALAFEDVNEIWIDVEAFRPRNAVHIKALRILDFNGEIHRLPLAVKKSVTLVTAILQKCSKPLLEEAKAALREGQTLTFGHVRLDRNGITIGDARATWRELSLAVQERAKLSFYGRSTVFSWGTVNLEKVPNPLILLDLVKTLVPKMRVDEHVLLPIAPDDDLSRLQRKPVTEEENKDAAKDLMLFGGVYFLVGFAGAIAIPSNPAAYVMLVFGAVRFFMGVSRYLSGPR